MAYPVSRLIKHLARGLREIVCPKRLQEKIDSLGDVNLSVDDLVTLSRHVENLQARILGDQPIC